MYNETCSDVIQIYCAIAIVAIVIIIISHWFIFKKAGEEGWKAIIPFYNFYTLCRISTGNGWIFLLGFIPYVNIVFSIYITVMMCKAFSKSTLFKFGAVILPIIFIPILAFNSDPYIGPNGDPDGIAAHEVDDGQVYSTTDNGCSTSVKNNPEFKDKEDTEKSKEDN